MCKPIITDTICGIAVTSLKQEATATEIAGLFCKLSDDEMAEFFVAVDAISKTWESSYGGPRWQWEKTGEHMAECPGACESDAIQVIEGILEGYRYKQEKMQRDLNNLVHQGSPDQPAEIANT